MPGSKLMYNAYVRWMEFQRDEWEVGCRGGDTHNM